MEEESVFEKLPYDLVLDIFFKLEKDPRDWARLACVCTEFYSLICNWCYKPKCISAIPSVVPELPSSSSSSPTPLGGWSSLHKLVLCCPGLFHAGVKPTGKFEFYMGKRRKICRSSHLAYGVRNLRWRKGNEFLSSPFTGDCVYICDWPGCVHIEEKRKHMVFGGFFPNFKTSLVWRTINVGNRKRSDLNCAFCKCKNTWDLHSFCLRTVYRYHNGREILVRAYVCENGHVSGAWTSFPL